MSTGTPCIVQAEYTSETSHSIALEMEEKAVIRKYMMNSNEEIGTQLRSLRPNTINRAQQVALEAEIWFNEIQKNKPQSSVFTQKPDLLLLPYHEKVK